MCTCRSSFSVFRWDYLEIRDRGDNSTFSIGKFCGYSDIYFLSYSTSVVIYFVTDELQNEQGFQLHYHTTGKWNKFDDEGLVTCSRHMKSRFRDTIFTCSRNKVHVFGKVTIASWRCLCG